jgi:chemotaxis protein MotB
MSGYRKRRRRSDHSVDDWLMTYADMITLLLCFFAIFLSVSMPKQEAFKQARAKVLEKFAKPDPNNPQHNEQSVSDNKVDMPYDKLPSIVDQYLSGNLDTDGKVVYLGRSDQKGDKKPGMGKTDKGDMKERPEGDRIKTFEVPSAAFFASGSANVSVEGQKLLQAIIDDHLLKHDMQDYLITVEGHTDDAPIRTMQFPSNWELSTARAAAVVRYFIEKGVKPSRLRASGYADSLPKLPNRDSYGKAIPDNQAQNRRVVIKLEKIEKDEE